MFHNDIYNYKILTQKYIESVHTKFSFWFQTVKLYIEAFTKYYFTQKDTDV